jgi:hypothetical protein
VPPICTIGLEYSQIKEQFASILHLHLHGAAALECLPAADNQSKVMSAKARVVVWSVLVGVPSTAQDDADLDSTLQPLLAQGQPLELLEAVTISCAIHGRVAENNVTHARVKDCRLDAAATAKFRALNCPLEHPGVPTFVLHKSRIVVTLVEILEDAGEYFRFLVRQIDASSVGFKELVLARSVKVRGVRKNVLMGREQSLVLSHHKCDDCGSEGRRGTGAAAVSLVISHF